jgi:hypothetical protein
MDNNGRLLKIIQQRVGPPTGGWSWEYHTNLYICSIAYQMASPVLYRILFGVLLLSVFGWCLYRDIQLEKQHTCDLPNRVIGARLEKDGKSPYFYRWKPTDGMRYFGLGPVSYGKASGMTASPFFHHLLAPIADLPQRTISGIWLVASYLMLLLCTVIAFTLAGNTMQRWTVIATSVLFLLTDAWKLHISNGQIYLVIPLLACLFYYFINKTSLLHGAIAGLTAIALVLNRPTALLYLLPFLLLIKHYRVRYLLAFFVPVVCILGWIISSQQERQLWLDYKSSISEHIKVHQGLPLDKVPPTPVPKYDMLEGWNKKEILDNRSKFTVNIHSENGNFFVLVNQFFHTKIPVALLNILSLTIILLLFTTFFIKAKKQHELLHPINIALLGYCLYMISDLFSPIHRHQYNGVQWLFPLLLAASLFNTKHRWIYFFIGLGLVLNIVNIEFVKMEHTQGEYIMLVAFLWLAFKPYCRPPS